MKIKVSELLVRFMERLGIDTIFGMPGAHILPVYDALHGSTIRSVLAKHEQGAAFMAGGYARAAEHGGRGGRIGACIATAGPGATNLITGVANAYADRQPLLVITGETSTHIFGRGGLQESTGEGGSIDQGALFASITKYHKTVERTDYLGSVLNQAAKALLADIPGPVLLSFPFNVQLEMVDAALLDGVGTARRQNLAPGAAHGNAPQIDALTDLILAAAHPVIVAGHGCMRSGAQATVSRLSEMLAIPVATSLKGKGVINEHAALSLGSLGVTSSGYARNHIIEQADLIIFLGAAFNERTSYVWDAALLGQRKIAQVDIDPAQIEKVFKADVAIVGDIDAVLSAVLERVAARGVEARPAVPPAVSGKSRLTGEGTAGSGPSLFDARFALVEHFFKTLERRFPGDIQIYDDNIVFAQNFLNVSTANRYHPNSGISSLGQAIPAAIGGRFALPLPTFAILGDGGFQMCCMELMTAVNYKLPLTVVMFSNATMGLIRKNQCQQYGQRYIDCDFVNPDYELLARSFGIAYAKIETVADIEATFARVDFEAAINLVEIMIDRDAFPDYISKR